MKVYKTVKVPAFEFHWNLVVYPHSIESVSDLLNKHLFISPNIQDESFFYVLKNNAVKPTPSSGHHWLELLPGYVYCFLPSLHDVSGEVHVYTSMPEYIKDFEYSMQIEQV